MKYKSFLPAVTWTAAVLFSGAAAKPLLGSQPRIVPKHDASRMRRVPQAETTPKPVASCNIPNLENNDGLCTCGANGVTFTTFTPDGGPGNSCQSSTVVIPSSLLAPPGAPAPTPTPDPTTGLWCSFPNLENNDGLCTCSFDNVPFTTFTPDGGPGNPCQSSTVVPPTATPTAVPNDGAFEWAVMGDSWSSGVAYSSDTLYKLTDREYCYRTNQAYGPMMENEAGSWIDGEQKFNFVACGGTKMDDIKRQLGLAGRPQLAIGTFGGNDGQFGNIARACIYKPPPGGWGKDYDDDPNGEGWCKKYLKDSREWIDNPGGLADTFESTIRNVYDFSQTDGQKRPRFDLYVSSYVKFFNADTDECDNWTFARWFSTGSPKLVKPLRAEMNELVGKFNDIQNDVITKYQSPGPTFNAHYVPISDKFEGHRFCEPNHSFEDQWYSADVWLWNLSWKNGNTAVDPHLSNPDPPTTTVTRRRRDRRQAAGGDAGQDEDASMNLQSTDENGLTRMGKPPNALDGPFPVLSLWTTDRNDLDNQDLPVGPTGGDNVDVSSQSGFGWTARPFHPKPLGANAMKDSYIAALRADKVPGVKG